MKIYSYYRTSELEATSDRGELETEVQTELLSIHTYCLTRNWLISEGVADLDCSWGLGFGARKKGGELLRGLKRGDKIISSKLERIASSGADALELIKSLRAKCVQLHIVDLGGDVTSEHIMQRSDLACMPDEATSDRYAEGYAAYRDAVASVAPLFETDGARL